jgi:hypothetical protein
MEQRKFLTALLALVVMSGAASALTHATEEPEAQPIPATCAPPRPVALDTGAFQYLPRAAGARWM